MCDNVMSEECQKSDNRCPTILPPFPPPPKSKRWKKNDINYQMNKIYNVSMCLLKMQ